MEAELVAATEAAKEAVYLDSFVKELGCTPIQDADNATLHWDWNPVRRPKAVTGHGSAGRRPSLGLHWARECRPKAVTGLHWARECRPKAVTGLHWARECRPDNMIHRPSVTQMVRLIIMAATTWRLQRSLEAAMAAKTQ